MKSKIWRDIPGWEGLYQASDSGEVRSLERRANTSRGSRKVPSCILRQTPNGPYLSVSLYKEGKRKSVRVHSLVASAFLGLCPPGQEVLHGPKGKEENSISNLSYGTHSENQLDQRRDGSNWHRPVLRSDGKRYDNIQLAAQDVSRSAPSITMVCRGRRHTCAGFGWSYL